MKKILALVIILVVLVTSYASADGYCTIEDVTNTEDALFFVLYWCDYEVACEVLNYENTLNLVRSGLCIEINYIGIDGTYCCPFDNCNYWQPCACDEYIYF